MSARNDPEKQRIYVQAARERKRKAGRVPLELWPHRDDVDAVREFAAELDRSRLLKSRPKR